MKTVVLGVLQKDQSFTYSGRPFVVVKNLGPAGVSVRPIVAKKVKIGDREFVSRSSKTQVWSASSEVEIHTPKGPEMAKDKKPEAAASSEPAKPRKTRTVRPPWSMEQWKKFIETWQAAASFEAVLVSMSQFLNTNLSADEARSRASKARENGVSLKEHGKIEWDELKKLGDPAPASPPPAA